MSTVSTKLEAIRSLAEVDLDSLPLGIAAIETGSDGVPSISHPPKPSRLRFVVQGLPFYAAVVPDDGGSNSQVWAEVGYLPFTVQSPAKRGAMLAILHSAQILPNALFVVQGGHKILLYSEVRTEKRITPEDIIHQTVVLLGEARPFLKLLGEYL